MTSAPDAVNVRPLVLADAAVFAGWASDRDFCLAADWSLDRSAAEHVSFHEQLIEAAPIGLLRLAAVHAGELVGWVDLHADGGPTRELGFLVGGRDRWGLGLGGRTAAAGVAHAFDVLELPEVWAEAVALNHASVRILERLGMDEVERGGGAAYRGAASYYRRFTLTREAWGSSRGAPN
ncbi:MAG: GNAT family N-acetyltransferase [Thermoleophilia bacterium]|nr:GNAT family N-acetyltransferase [Thermoleophilia bacterium]